MVQGNTICALGPYSGLKEVGRLILETIPLAFPKYHVSSSEDFSNTCVSLLGHHWNCYFVSSEVPDIFMLDIGYCEMSNGEFPLSGQKSGSGYNEEHPPNIQYQGKLTFERMWYELLYLSHIYLLAIKPQVGVGNVAKMPHHITFG